MKYLIIPILFLLVSCERFQDVEVEVPYKPKSVVVCMLGAGLNQVVVSVTESTPVFGTEPTYQSNPKYITDAQLYLESDQQQWSFTYDTTRSLYYADLGGEVIQTGKQYTLRVTSNNQLMEGSVVIPPPFNKNIQIKRDTFFDDTGTLQFQRIQVTYTGDGSEWYEGVFPYLIYADSNRFLMTEEYNTSGYGFKAQSWGDSYAVFPLFGYLARVYSCWGCGQCLEL